MPDLTASYYTSAGYAGPQSFAYDIDPLEFSTDFLRDKVKERADSGVEIQFGIGYAIPVSNFDGKNDGIIYLPFATNSNNFAEGRIYYANKILLTVAYLE